MHDALCSVYLSKENNPNIKPSKMTQALNQPEPLQAFQSKHVSLYRCGRHKSIISPSSMPFRG